MHLDSSIARLRIPLTRGVAVVFALVLTFSSSRWEDLSAASNIFFLVGCVLVGIASLGRLWCSLYIAGHKNRSLVTLGPYSICRHPLYFSSLLGAVGVGLGAESVGIPFLVLILYAIYYPAVIRSEDSKLLSIYGEEFSRYREKTPAFIPKWSLLNEPESYVLKPRIYRKEMFSALWFIWLIGVIEMVEALQELNILPVLIRIY